MRDRFYVLFAVVMAASMIGAPIWYQRRRDRESRNFRVVDEGVLYRSGQLTLHRLRQLVAAHEIRTVISLREDKSESLDDDEETWVKAKALNFVRIPYRQWYPDEKGNIPADQSVKTFRDVIDDPTNHPVLVHCYAGIHRTGTMCAIYRMDFQGWTNEEAMNEMRTLGYTMLDEHRDIHSYLTNYRPVKKTPFRLTGQRRP